MIGTFTVLSVIMPAFYIQDYNLFLLILKGVIANPINFTKHTACSEFKYFGTKVIFSHQLIFIFYFLFTAIIFITSVLLLQKFL